MNRVFIGGSRHISHLTDDIKSRLKNIVEKHLQVLLGDASGADKAVQSYFKQVHYNDVLVYCSGNSCRNNIGNWNKINVSVPPNLQGLQFYMVKDSKMAEDSDYGFMLWDGKSSGTLSNVLNLLSRQKRTLLYFSPTKEFITIAKLFDLKQLLMKCDKSEIAKIDKKIGLYKTIDTLSNPIQTNLAFSSSSLETIEI